METSSRDVDRVSASAPAHWVLCSQAKRAVRPAWQKNPASNEEALSHLSSGGRIGIIPHSIGMAVIDVDHGGREAADAVERRLGPALGRIDTPSGGYHLWYRCSLAAAGIPLGNSKWALPEGDGDIRGSKGYVVVWDLESLARISETDGTPVDVRDIKNGNRNIMPAGVREAQPGQRNDRLNAAAFQQALAGTLDVEEMTKAALAAGLTPEETRNTIESAQRGAAAVRIRSTSASDLAAILDEMQIDFRYNVRGERTEWAPTGRRWNEIDDMAESAIIHQIAKEYRTARGSRLMFSAEAWRSAIQAILHQRRTDPFLDWLKELPDWDGIPRLHLTLTAVFETVDAKRELAEWAGRSIFMAAVMRAMKPGSQHHEIVVLIGPQGAGKSTWCRNLVDTISFPEFYTDGLNMAGTTKERVESILGSVIVECSEMTGTTKAELESLKGFITRGADRLRLSFRRNPETIPRRSVIVGTTNDTSSLPNDPTGNRRFVPIPVTGNPERVVEWLEANRMNLWSEAYRRVRDGETAHLPPELIEAQKEAAEQHRRSDEIMENKIADWLEREPINFTMQDALEALGFSERREHVDQRLVHRIARTLTLHGYTKNRVRVVGGKQQIVWNPPPVQSS